MTQSVYSWMGTPLHLVLEDDYATSFNEAQAAFFQAQRDHTARTGSEWNGQGPLLINWTEKQRDAFNAMGDLVNLMIKINGGSLNIPEEQMTSDYLVKL